MTRIVSADRAGGQREVERLVATICAAELIAPGDKVVLAAASLHDIGILDNRAGAFTGLEPHWPPRAIRLTEVLAALLRRSTSIVIVTPASVEQTPPSIGLLTTAARDIGALDRLVVRRVDPLPASGLVCPDCALHGPLELTAQGIRAAAAELHYETEPERIASVRAEFRDAYGPVAG